LPIGAPAWRRSLKEHRADRRRTPLRRGDRALPADGVLVADTGYSGIWTGTMIEMDGIDQTYLRAAGSLGWAFPASLGAKCAAGDRKVICFTGDGGFYYHLAELESACRCNIPVVIIVNNNSGFGRNLTGRRIPAIGRQGEELVRFGPTTSPRSRGASGARHPVEQPGEIAAALQQALAADGPVVVDS